MNCQSSKDLLNAYSDGELDLMNHLEIEKHLKACPACELAFENQVALRSALADESLYLRAPDGLRDRISGAIQPAEPPTTKGISIWRFAPVFATIVVMIVLIFVFLQTGSSNDDLLAGEIVSDHVRSMMANHLTDVPSSDQHTVKPWFEGKLDYSPPVVDLAAKGFPLVGGRLDYAASRPIAALVYQRHQHYINLFVFPSTGDVDGANRMAVRQGYNLIHWSRSGMTFWAVSDLNLNELQEFAQALQN